MALPSGRRQSSRQVRTSTTRPHNYYARHFASQPVNVATPTDEEPGFFPAITHFTDAADALPREVMRHFSMLKEVEAKLHAPDEELAKLAEQIGKVSSLKRKSRDGSIAGASGSGTAPNGSNGSSMTVVNASDLERRQFYRKLNYSVAVMAPMLDEKIAVLSTANMTLTRQLERLESSYLHIPGEVSDEARLGSTTHWAYMAEKETKKAGAERTRREVAATNNLAAAAAAVHDQDVAAARSEARREAVLARKIRNQHVDSDFEDRPAPRRPYGKNRKQAEANTAVDAKSHGSGVASAPGPGKRRKNAASANATERSISGAVGRVRGIASPTPGSEGGRKRKNPPGPVPGKKRYIDITCVQERC
jgi:Inhibitor of growth proteins N-terminal histone-binding